MNRPRNDASSFPPQSAFLYMTILDEYFEATVWYCQEECNTMLSTTDYSRRQQCPYCLPASHLARLLVNHPRTSSALLFDFALIISLSASTFSQLCPFQLLINPLFILCCLSFCQVCAHHRHTPYTMAAHEENIQDQFDGENDEEYINPEDVEYVEDEEEGGDVPMDEDDEDDDEEAREPPVDNSLGHSGMSLFP